MGKCLHLSCKNIDDQKVDDLARCRRVMLFVSVALKVVVCRAKSYFRLKLCVQQTCGLLNVVSVDITR